MNSTIGMFSVLVIGVMMLLIPTTSIANAQEYNRHYDEVERYIEDYIYEYEDNQNTTNTKLTLTDSQIELVNEIIELSGKPFELVQLDDSLALIRSGDDRVMGISQIDDRVIDVVLLLFLLLCGDNSFSNHLGNDDGTFTESDDRVMDAFQIDDLLIDDLFEDDLVLDILLILLLPLCF